MILTRLMTLWFSIAFLVLLSGCANWNTAYRDFDVDEAGAMVDIKQRAIIASKNGEAGRTIVCAEPSPDALSAHAAEFASELSVPA